MLDAMPRMQPDTGDYHTGSGHRFAWYFYEPIIDSTSR